MPRRRPVRRPIAPAPNVVHRTEPIESARRARRIVVLLALPGDRYDLGVVDLRETTPPLVVNRLDGPLSEAVLEAERLRDGLARVWADERRRATSDDHRQPWRQRQDPKRPTTI